MFQTIYENKRQPLQLQVFWLKTATYIERRCNTKQLTPNPPYNLERLVL